MTEELDKESIMKDLDRWHKKLDFVVITLYEINEDFVNIAKQIKGG